MNDTVMHQVKAEYAANKSWSSRGSLEGLVNTLQKQLDSKVDFVTDARNLRVRCEDGVAILCPSKNPLDGHVREFLPREGLPLSINALPQLGTRVSPNIPAGFLRELIATRGPQAERLLTDLLWETGNTADNGKGAILVRCLEDRVRALLSRKFAPLDNWDLVIPALEVLREHGGEVIEASLSETKMRLKMTTREIFDALNTRRDGDNWFAGGLGDQTYLSKVAAKSEGALPGGPGTYHPMVAISNSETGHGGTSVDLGPLFAVCFNLATVMSVARQVHLGRALNDGFYSQTTLQADGKLRIEKIRDAVRNAFQPELFAKLTRYLKKAAEAPVEATAVLDYAVSEGVISENERESVLTHFLGESASQLYGQTALGFAQGLTRYAQTQEAEESWAIEDFAGTVISKPGKLVQVSESWKKQQEKLQKLQTTS